jgi:hypothetical protein
LGDALDTAGAERVEDAVEELWLAGRHRAQALTPAVVAWAVAPGMRRT